MIVGKARRKSFGIYSSPTPPIGASLCLVSEPSPHLGSAGPRSSARSAPRRPSQPVQSALGPSEHPSVEGERQSPGSGRPGLRRAHATGASPSDAKARSKTSDRRGSPPQSTSMAAAPASASRRFNAQTLQRDLDGLPSGDRVTDGHAAMIDLETPTRYSLAALAGYRDQLCGRHRHARQRRVPILPVREAISPLSSS